MRSTGATTCTMVNRTSSIVPERRGIASAAVCGSHLVTATRRFILGCTRRSGNSTVIKQLGSRPELRIAKLYSEVSRFCCWWRASLLERADSHKLGGLLDHGSLLFGLELRVHRQRKDFRTDLFGDREITLLVAEVLVGLL